MRRACLLVLLLAVPRPAPAADRGPPRNEGNLIHLGIAIDQSPDRASKENVDSYDYCAQEIEQALEVGGKPLFRRVETRLVLGAQVTLAHARAGLAWLQHNTTAQDLVVLSIDAHGFTDAREGWGMETADGQTLWGHEVKAALGRLPCPAVVVVETCTSGAFARFHSRDVPLPPNVTALCACRPAQSTDNHLSIAVSEALWGMADFDKDGVVTVDELLRYVAQRHKELDPDEKVGKDNELPLLVPAKEVPAGLALTTVSPDLAAVAVRGEWYGALVGRQEGNKVHVHLLGWSSKPGPYFLTDVVDRSHVWLPSDPPPVKVEAGGKVRLARLLSQTGDRWTVHYLNAKNNKEAVVPRGRVQLLFGEQETIHR